MEAQRYPEDFDGIVSGAAASQWTELFSSFVWTESLNLANRASYPILGRSRHNRRGYNGGLRDARHCQKWIYQRPAAM
jgi:hypothetical protein